VPRLSWAAAFDGRSATPASGDRSRVEAMSGTFRPEQAAGGNGSDGPSGEGYEIEVASFKGPLDLLLHLVRVNEVDILDIPIVKITEQYNHYLELMRDLNLEIAGEYLVMAATLMHIKSRMLLPPDPGAEDEEEDDPRAELARELLEYERFKQAAENLQAMDSRRSLVWTRLDVPDEFRGEELLAVDLFDLLRAFRGLLGRLGEEARLQLKRDTVSVADKIQWLGELLERRKTIDALALLADLPTRLDRIATFLAILEMVRLQLIVVFQRKALGDIRIARVKTVDDAQAQPVARESSPDVGAAETEDPDK
jgi:segregation and condensation protein A